MVRTRHKTRGKGMYVYAIRNKKGEFKNIENIGKATYDDSMHKAKKIVKSGYGYMGDLKRKAKKGWFGQSKRHSLARRKASRFAKKK